MFGRLSTTTGGVEVAISRILGHCGVVPLGEGVGARSSTSRQVFSGAEFIRHASGAIYNKVWCPSDRPQTLAWRFEGLDRLYFNRGAPGVHRNTAGLPVMTLPLLVFTDGFNFFRKGGSPFSVNATHFAIGSTTRAFRRRLSSWDLCCLGAPRARWEQELDSLFKTLGEMQNGCRARARIDRETKVVGVACGGQYRFEEHALNAPLRTQCSFWGCRLVLRRLLPPTTVLARATEIAPYPSVLVPAKPARRLTYLFPLFLQVFLRTGVVAINADSPAQRTLCNCKRSNSGTWKPCNVCCVTQPGLGNGQFDFASKPRTMDGIDYSLELVRREGTASKRKEVSRREGVVGAFDRNPVRDHLHLNPIKSVGVDILHQDALVSDLRGWPQEAKGVIFVVRTTTFRRKLLW